MPTRNEILCFVLLAGIQLHIANVFSSGAATPGPTVTYTDKASVEADGWTVSFGYVNSNYSPSSVTSPESCGATGNYYAFSGSAAVGHMTKVLSGSGTGVLTVGNCWSDGTVRVYKNDVAIGSADVVPASSSADSAASFIKTGCPNYYPNSYWGTISDPAAFNDMYAYCDLNANGGANTAQSDACCGTGLTCTPTCIRQTTGTQVPVEFTYVDGDELTIKDEGADSIILLTSLTLTPHVSKVVTDSLVLNDDKTAVLVGDEAGRVFAFSTADGTALWHNDPGPTGTTIRGLATLSHVATLSPTQAPTPPTAPTVSAEDTITAAGAAAAAAVTAAMPPRVAATALATIASPIVAAVITAMPVPDAAATLSEMPMPTDSDIPCADSNSCLGNDPLWSGQECSAVSRHCSSEALVRTCCPWTCGLCEGASARCSSHHPFASTTHVSAHKRSMSTSVSRVSTMR